MHNKIQITSEIVLGALLVVALLTFSIEDNSNHITGNAVQAEGCCTLTCQQTTDDDCPTDFHSGQQCAEISACNVGCCIDGEGYCLSNYLAGNCDRVNGRFITKHECLHEPVCITEPKLEDIRSYIGFPFIYTRNQDGFMFSDQIVGNPGQIFTLKSFIFNSDQSTKLRARVRTDNYEKLLALYDDGAHGDGNADDNLFAALWRSGDVPAFNGLKRVNITGEIDGEALIIPDYVFLSTSQCIPLQKPWFAPEERQDIIFSVIHPQQSINAFSPLGIVSFLFTQTSIDEITKRNYAVIDNQLMNTAQEAQAKIERGCDFYTHAQDKIIILDGDAQQCKQFDNVIITPQDIVINETARERFAELSFDEFLDNFCSLVQTVAQRNAFEIEKYRPPEIALYTPINGTYSDREIEFRFIVNDTRSEETVYEIYMDIYNPIAVLAKGVTQRNTPIIKKLNVTDGDHLVWVEATDNDENSDISEIRRINVDVSNFMISGLTLEALSFNETPDINFTLSHKTEQHLDYTVYINRTPRTLFNASVFTSGIAAVGQKVNITTNLTNGTYIVQIVSKDSSGDIAQSLPTIFGIGVPEEEIR